MYFLPFSYKYTVCSFTGNCNELTAWDYISDPEIYSVYIACAFHFVFWGMALKIADVKKDGGQIFGSNKVGDKVITWNNVRRHLECQMLFFYSL